MKKILLGVLVLGAVGFGFMYLGEDHQRYLEFDRDRDAWHKRCDVFVDKKDSSEEAKDCARQLAAMMAYAKRQGW